MEIRIAEQVLLLALNETSGKIYPLPDQYLDYAIAGALLMELVFKEHIRLHQGMMKTLTPAPTGDAVLDKMMALLPSQGNSEAASVALADLAAHTGALTPLLLEDLVKKGVLEQGSYRYLWFFTEPTFPAHSIAETTSIKKHLREILFQGRTPTENEAVLIGIAHVCNLLSHLFSPEDLKAAEPRIRKLIRFEIINHVLSNALGEFQNTVLTTVANIGM